MDRGFAILMVHAQFVLFHLEVIDILDAIQTIQFALAVRNVYVIRMHL